MNTAQLKSAAMRLRMKTRLASDREHADIVAVSDALLELLDRRYDPRSARMYPSIQTFSGRYFDFLHPERFDWTPEDIAHHLSLQSRFTGATRNFYSTAQHSVLAARRAPPGYKFEALMHDAHEFAYGDMSTPLKLVCPDYVEQEKRGEAAMRAFFGLPAHITPTCKEVDRFMLAWEKRDQMSPETDNWEIIADIDLDGVPTLYPWTPEVAKRAFLKAYNELRDERHAEFSATVERRCAQILIPAWMDEADTTLPVTA